MLENPEDSNRAERPFIPADLQNRLSFPRSVQVQIAEATPERPALRRGVDLLANGAAVIVGISLGNSYFSKTRLAKLFQVMESLESELYILPMDLPAEHNYRALGYSEQKVQRKIKEKGGQVQCSIQAALEEVRFDSSRATVIDWSSIRSDRSYCEQRNHLATLYTSCIEFQRDLQQTVTNYITPKLQGASLSSYALASAEQYLFEELAFLLASPEILGEEELCYLYHREWPIYERLVSGRYATPARDDLGFVELVVGQGSG